MAVNEQKLAQLTKERIDSFERWAEARYEMMRNWYQLYQGEFFARHQTLESELYYDVKLIYSIINGFIPSIILADPDIFIRPRKEDSVEVAQLVELVANYYWKELNIKKELKKVLLDTYIYGFGVMKTGWVTKFKSREKKMDSTDPGGVKDEHVSEYIQTDNPFMCRISPFMFMWDPQARTLDGARWVGERIIRPVEHVINNKAYDSRALMEVQPTNFGAQHYIFNEEGGHLVDDNPDKYVMLYEIHDRERNLLITTAHGVERPLRVIPYPYKKLEGTHYGMLVLHPLPDKVEGLSLVQLLWDQQIALNRARTLQANHAKRCARMYAVNAQSDIKQEDLEKLQQAQDGAIIMMNDSPDQIKAVEHAVLPQELFVIADIARGDMLQIAGSPPHRFGMPAGGRTSATEIQSMNVAEQFRLEDARAVVEDFSADLTRKLIQIVADKLSDEKVVMIAGPERFVPLKFSKKELQGEFDFTIDAGSMSRPNREVERQQLMQFLNMVAQIPGVNAIEIVKRIAKTFNWRRLDDIIQEAPQVPGAGMAGGQLSNTMQTTPNPPSPVDMISTPGAEGDNTNER